MLQESRLSGVLLHPTSLPGPLGRGDLGPAAHAFLEDLAAAGQGVWQVMPLHPPGYGGSPYAGGSAFAGDPLLISPELLVEDGLLEPKDLDAAPRFPEGRLSHESDRPRRRLLRRAWERFQTLGSAEERQALAAFRERESYWLEDWALFAAVKEAHDQRAFWEWPPARLRRALPGERRAALHTHRDAVEAEVFYQHLFFRQWGRLRRRAHQLGIKIMGDVPIFVARDSADVWAHPELFCLDAAGELEVQAGVPPDAFSDDGQLWGNPLYDWKVHARTAWAWWIERLRTALALTDLVRIDHFRGFASYWEVPIGEPTARGGRWVPGPRMALFRALRGALGEDLPIVAEDLGELTPDVPELLEASGLPGMKVLQFAWDADPDHPFKPENYDANCVVYTGTHDNETTAGWWTHQEDEVQQRVLARVGAAGPVWGLIELALASRACLAIVPAQDLLELGNEARMNHPGRANGNWSWRLLPGQLDRERLARLRALTERHGRLPTPD